MVRLVPDLATIAAFALASLALLVIPGPAVIYVVNRSVADGREVGLAAVAGLELGSFVHVVAAAVGLSAVLATSATAFTTVKWLGAGYLVLVGIQTLRTRPEPVERHRRHLSLGRAFRQGVVVNTLNPKVALFFLSFLPQFIDPGRGSAGLQALALGTVFVLLGFVCDGTYALTASALRDRLLRGRALEVVQRYVAGAVFIVLGLLAATTHPAKASTTP
jgi:threonine/homoserine/homoserine lactone efflux protein